MIDITSQVIEVAKRMPGINWAGRTYPQAKIKPPYIVVAPMGHMAELTDGDGSEIHARLTYSIDIQAASPSEVDRYLSGLADRLARYNLHLTGQSPMFEASNSTYRVSATFDGLVDRRGHTFR